MHEQVIKLDGAPLREWHLGGKVWGSPLSRGALFGPSDVGWANQWCLFLQWSNLGPSIPGTAGISDELPESRGMCLLPSSRLFPWGSSGFPVTPDAQPSSARYLQLRVPPTSATPKAEGANVEFRIPHTYTRDHYYHTLS